MKVTSLNCPNCNSPLDIAPGQEITKCPSCGSTIGVDDGALKVKVSLSDQEEAGYQFEKGRQRAQRERIDDAAQPAAAPVKKRKTWLWVLGWICIFPVPLTILMLNSPRTKGLDKKVRIGVVVAAWVIYLAIGMCGNATSGTAERANANANAGNAAVEQAADANAEADASTPAATKQSAPSIDTFVSEFNGASEPKLVFSAEFAPSDKTGSHYRTEFRLGAFSNATGSSYEYGASTVDLVSYGSGSGFRLYAAISDADAASSLIEHALPIMDSSITADKANEAAQHVASTGDVNGYSCGDVEMVYNSSQGLMLKIE